MSTFILYSLCRTGIVMAVAAVVAVVLLRLGRYRSPRIHRLVWGFVLLQGLLWVQWPVYLVVLPPVSVESVRVADVPFVQQSYQEPVVPMIANPNPGTALHSVPGSFDFVDEIEQKEQRTPLDIPTLLVGVWLIGLAAIAAARLIAFVRLLFALRTAERVVLPDGVNLLLTEEIGPAIVQLPGGQAVLVPKALWDEASSAVRQGILKHELAHAAHRDGLKSFIFASLAAVQWFNPASWYALRRFDEAAEWRCDAAAYGNDDDSLALFAESLQLLRKTTPRYVAVVRSFKNHDLNDRVRRLKEYNIYPKESMMKNLPLIAVMAALLCCGLVHINLVAQTPKESKQDQSVDDEPLIRGVVMDEANNRVAGAIVRIIGDTAEKDLETTTNENGEFILKKPDGEYGILYATDADRTKMGQSQWFGGTTPQSFAQVTVLKTCRVITGTVTGTDDKPAEGILVAGSDQTVRSEIVRTDKNGNFRFLHPEDEHTQLRQVIAYKKGVGMDICATEEINPYRQPKSKMSGQISNGPFSLKLAPIKQVQVRVVNEEGEPLAGATVRPWLIQKPPLLWSNVSSEDRERHNFNTVDFMPGSFAATTDENGIATLDCVPKTFLVESTFTAYGPRDGIEGSDGSKRFYGDEKNRWNQLEIKNGLRTFTLPRQGSIRGTVKLEDGTPVPGVNITVRYHNGSCGGSNTDQNGEFRLLDNVNTLYNLSFESNQGAAPAVFNISVGDGTEEKRLDVVLKPGIRMYGKVFMPDGSPAKDYYVWINEKDPTPLESYLFRDADHSDAGRDATLYTNNKADRDIFRGLFPEKEPGTYETLLPAVPREYSFRAVRYPTKENPEFSADVPNVRLEGTETEFQLDFHLSER